MSDRPTLLLVHGGWSGRWAWAPVEGALAAAGWSVTTIDLPTVHSPEKARLSLSADAAAVSAAIDTIDGDVVVVAHSYGGAVVSQAATSDKVTHIVYVAAFALDAGESVLGAVGGQAPPWWIIDGDLVTPMPPAPPEGVVLDGPALEFGAMLAARTQSQAYAAYTEALTEAAWRSHPTTFLITTQDTALPTPAQEMFAARAGSTIVRVDSDHFPMFSNTDDVVRVITTAAS